MQALEELIQNILELLDVMIYVTNIIMKKIVIKSGRKCRLGNPAILSNDLGMSSPIGLQMRK